jgi:hypothetical protein
VAHGIRRARSFVGAPLISKLQQSIGRTTAGVTLRVLRTRLREVATVDVSEELKKVAVPILCTLPMRGGNRGFHARVISASLSGADRMRD